MIHIIGLLGGVAILAFIMLEAFETIILPRTASRELRLSRLVMRTGWRSWRYVAGMIANGSRRESFLSYYAPMQMPIVLGLWAFGLVFGFALIVWGLRLSLNGAHQTSGLFQYFYLSGTTFFTLGYGDLTPATSLGRMISVLEAGFGIGFLAMVIGYFPVLNGAFSRREIIISLLDARAGTPPAAAEFLRRHSMRGDTESIPLIIREWEQWSAELLESNLSYPVLAMYRSQHDRESWLSALTMVLDVCSLVIAGIEGIPVGPAKLAFAMARHAAIDTGLVFDTPPIDPPADRLSSADLQALRKLLYDAGMTLRDSDEADRQLDKLRKLYEPYVYTLSLRFLMPLPPWIASPDSVDNWQTSAWDKATKGDLHF